MPDQAYRTDLSANELKKLRDTLARKQAELKQIYTDLPLDGYDDKTNLRLEWYANQYHANVADLEDLNKQRSVTNDKLIALYEKQAEQEKQGAKFNADLWDQIQKAQDELKAIDKKIEPLEKFKNNYEKFPRLEDETHDLEAQIEAGEPLGERVRDFNNKVFKFEDARLADINKYLEKIYAVQAQYQIPSSYSFIQICIDNIMQAESIKEMVFFRDAFVRAIDDLAIVDVTKELNIQRYAEELEAARGNDAKLADLHAKIKAEVNKIIASNPYIIEANNNKLEQLNRDLHNETDADKRNQLEERIHHLRISTMKRQVALQQAQEWWDKMQKIFQFAANPDQVEKLHLAINDLDKYQQAIRDHQAYIQSCKLNVNALCLARAAYLKPGYGLIESMQQGEGTKEAFVEFIKDDIKNIGEVVTAFPFASQAYTNFTLAFDIVNISAELAEAGEHRKVPIKLGERPSPPKGWLHTLDRAATLFLGVAGMVASALLAFTIVGVGAAIKLAAASTAMIDTAWGGGHFIHEKWHEIQHNKHITAQVNDLEAAENERNNLLAKRGNAIARENASHAQGARTQLKTQDKSDAANNGRDEKAIFGLLGVAPSAPSAQAVGLSAADRSPNSSDSPSSAVSTPTTASNPVSPDAPSTPSSSASRSPSSRH